MEQTNNTTTTTGVHVDFTTLEKEKTTINEFATMPQDGLLIQAHYDKHATNYNKIVDTINYNDHQHTSILLK